MTSTLALRDLMKSAVRASLLHVEGGGLPFVGIVAIGHYVTDPGTNAVRRTGDPTAHAEVVAIRQAVADLGRDDLEGAVLVASGEPCGLCCRVAAEHGIRTVRHAVGQDVAAQHGFDYRDSYRSASGTTVASEVLEVTDALAPFIRYAELRGIPLASPDDGIY